MIIRTEAIISNPPSFMCSYHSNYDSYWWQSVYGDPGFLYHVSDPFLHLLLAQIVEYEGSGPELCPDSLLLL